MFLLGPCGWQVRYGFEPSLRGVIEMRSQTRALTSDAVLRLYGWHLLAHLVEILKYVQVFFEFALPFHFSILFILLV